MIIIGKNTSEKKNIEILKYQLCIISTIGIILELSILRKKPSE